MKDKLFLNTLTKKERFLNIHHRCLCVCAFCLAVFFLCKIYSVNSYRIFEFLFPSIFFSLYSWTFNWKFEELLQSKTFHVFDLIFIYWASRWCVRQRNVVFEVEINVGLGKCDFQAFRFINYLEPNSKKKKNLSFFLTSILHSETAKVIAIKERIV